MSDLFLSPHNLGDDETLFGSFTILRHQPTVVICFKSQVQQDRGGPTAKVREMETEGALWWLGGPPYIQSTIFDTDPDPFDKLAGMMVRHDAVYGPERVWAPAYEDGGHDQHNMIGELALEIFGDKVQGYATYKRGHGRTRTNVEVECEPEWPALKLAAMACYRSQIRIENTRPWFFDADAQREWWAE